MGTVLCAGVWKQVYFLFQKQKSDKPSAVVEKVLFLFLFVEFEISCDSAGWMSEENTGIQTTGCAFRTLHHIDVTDKFEIFNLQRPLSFCP